MVRRTVYFSGNVQGVGFRYTAHRVAHGFAVTGFVRNLPDGRVELVAEGEREELKRFQAAIHEAMDGNIAQAEGTDTVATGEFRSFDVRR